MSVQARDGKYIVRWRRKDKQHSKSFDLHADALAFDKRMKLRLQKATAARHLRMFDQHLADGGEQVYVVQGGDRVKIGKAVNPRGRVVAMQTGSPLALTLVWQIHCADASRLERAFHQRYKEHRQLGEWFDAAPVLADIQSLAALGACQFVANTAPENSGDTECYSALGESA